MWALPRPWRMGLLCLLGHGVPLGLFCPLVLGSFGPPSVHGPWVCYLLVLVAFLRVFSKPSYMGLEALSRDSACKTKNKNKKMMYYKEAK